MSENTDNHGRAPSGKESLIPKHGGFRNLKTFQLAQLVYDITVRFCDRFVSRRSRTHDQMVQAARSGTQNIAEGSVDSATSKKIELKLTGIAKGSLEELRLDYQDYLRQRSLPEWPPDHPALMRFKALRCSTLEEFRAWVAEEARKEKNTDEQGRTRTDTNGVKVGGSPCVSVFPSVCVANGALSLLNLCIYLLDRQLRTLAGTFEKEGGFTERLYRIRSERRRNN
ncbi:MAG: four helix bundle suffix domain-containing protein [Kiritimatiellales bacterium]|jgi:four helix bundle suffix protein